MPKSAKARLTLWLPQPIHEWFSQRCRRQKITMSELVRSYINILYQLHEEEGDENRID